MIISAPDLRPPTAYHVLDEPSAHRCPPSALWRREWQPTTLRTSRRGTRRRRTTGREAEGCIKVRLKPRSAPARAGRPIAGLVAAAEGALALLARAVGPGLPVDAAARALLDPIVADCGRRSQRVRQVLLGNRRQIAG